MISRKQLVCGLLFSFSTAQAMTHLSGPDYNRMSAEEKQSILWEEVMNTRYSGDELPIQPPGFCDLTSLLYSPIK